MLVLFSGPTAYAEPVSQMPYVTTTMLTSDFWLNKLPDRDQVLLDPSQVELMNQEMRNRLKNTLIDLKSYPETLSRQQVLKYLQEYSFPTGVRYSQGKIMTSQDYENLKVLINEGAVPDTVEVKVGFTVRKTDLRTFPTQKESVSSPEEHDFDAFQESELWPAEPVAILHHSQDDEWYYIQCRNYRGWVLAKDVALSSRQEWLKIMTADPFLVVTANHLYLGYNPYDPGLSRLDLPMGTRLPIWTQPLPVTVDGLAPSGNYVVSYPCRAPDGHLQMKPILIPYGSDVSEGYLPYTTQNVLQQAFKMQGERYSWGGRYDGRDCSSFIMSVYRTMGLEIPRNADQQEASAGQKFSLSGMSVAAKQRQLQNARPGALLHLGGHVMLYLGEHEGRYYAIHDFTSYGDLNRPIGQEYARIYINQVVVSELSLPLKRSGAPLLAAVTTVNPVLPKSTIPR